MRVLAIDIQNHPGIGDLFVDFRTSEGRPARLIVIAGENGCGKTALLETIFAAMAPTMISMSAPRRLSGGRYKVYIELDEPNTSTAFQVHIAPELMRETRDRFPDFSGIVIEIDGTKSDDMYLYHKYSRLSDNMATPGNFDSTDVLERPFGCFYSEASVSFEVPRIETIRVSAGENTDLNRNVNVAFPVRSGALLAQEVAQLLVDLKAADAADVARWLESNTAGRPPKDIITKRIGRFTEAFSRVSNKCFVGTETINGEHRAVFEEHGYRTPLAHLSTGEKQIVFRGAFLLRKYIEISRSVILIDEPELSLHPDWQTNILAFYDSIAREERGSSNQIIVATHSPFVVHGSPNALHVILRRDRATGRVSADSSPRYPDATTYSTAVAAFDLKAFENAQPATRMAMIVEGPTDLSIIRTAWSKLRAGTEMPFVILPAGGARGVQQMLGSDPQLAGPLITALSNTSIDRVLGLFDFDVEGRSQWNGAIKRKHASEECVEAGHCVSRRKGTFLVWAALLPIPPHRAKYAHIDDKYATQCKLTIELLFPSADVDAMLSTVPVLCATEVTLVEASDSQKLAVSEAIKRLPPESFQAFEPIFSLVDTILRA